MNDPLNTVTGNVTNFLLNQPLITVLHLHIYDGDHCIADTDASGNPLRLYTWGVGVDNLLAVTAIDGATTNTYYAIKDHLNTVHALVDASGTIAASYTYDTWGNVLSTSINSSLLTSHSLRFLFQGREYSSATGLYNFRARWYNPEWGRWLSKDPIGLEGGLNLYVFCGNDPVNYVDPYGLCEEKTWLQKATDEIAEPMNNAAWNIRNGIGLLRNKLLGEPTRNPDKLPSIVPAPPEPFSGDELIDAAFFMAGMRMGPSGKTQINKARFSTQKGAKDAARLAGKGAPVKHPSPQQGHPHYHPTDATGNKIPGSTHYEY